MGLIDDPGAFASDYFAGQSNGDGSLPNDIGNLEPSYSPALLSTNNLTPTYMADDYDSLGIDSSLLAQNVAKDLGNSGTNSGYSGFGSLFGSILSPALKDLQALYINPAIAQAQIPAQQQALSNQVALQSAQAQIQTNSLTTILFWGTIAFVVVSLIKKT